MLFSTKTTAYRLLSCTTIIAICYYSARKPIFNIPSHGGEKAELIQGNTFCWRNPVVYHQQVK